MKRATLVVATALILFGCDRAPSADEKNSQARKKLMEKATAKVPVPDVDNFLTRQYVAEWVRRMDDPSKVFYIYLIADTGNPVGYYVGTRPISLCTLMTPPEKRQHDIDGDMRMPAPTLSGVYGSGGGGCDTYYFFDSETDALIHFSGFNYFTADEPLGIDAEPIKVNAQSDG